MKRFDRVGSKFLRFQELEIEIDECNAEIERLRQREADAARKQGKLVGKLRITTAPVPSAANADSKTRLRQGKPTRPVVITNNQVATDASRVVSTLRDDPWSTTAQPAGHVRVIPSGSLAGEGADVRESFVSKTRRRAIEADYYKQVRLAQLEAECELKENVRIRAAREARKMRLAAEQQRQHEEMSKTKDALASVRSPVASGRSRRGDKERPADATSIAAAVSPPSEEHPTQANDNPERGKTGAAAGPGGQDGEAKRTIDPQTDDNKQPEGGEEQLDDPPSTDGAHAIASPPSLQNDSGEDELGEVRSIHLGTVGNEVAAMPSEVKTQAQQDLITEVALAEEATIATAPANENATTPSPSSGTASSTIEPVASKADILVEAPGDQPGAADDCIDDDKSQCAVAQPEHDDHLPSDVEDIADEPLPLPVTTTRDDEPVCVDHSADKMKMYEGDEFDDGDAEDDDVTVEEHCNTDARSDVGVQEATLTHDTPEKPPTSDVQEEVADEVTNGISTDAGVDAGPSDSAPMDVLKRSPTVHAISLVECTPNDSPTELPSTELATSQAMGEGATDVLRSIDGPNEQSGGATMGEESSRDASSSANRSSVDDEADKAIDGAAKCDEDPSAMFVPQLEPTEGVPVEPTHGDDGAQSERYQAVADTPSLRTESAGSEPTDEQAGTEADSATTPTADDDDSQSPPEPLSPDTAGQRIDQAVHNDEEDGKATVKEAHDNMATSELNVGALRSEQSAMRGEPEDLLAVATDGHHEDSSPATLIAEGNDSTSSGLATEDDAVAYNLVARAEVDEPDIAISSGVDDTSCAEPALAASTPDPDELDAQPTHSPVETPTALSGHESASTPREDEVSVTARSKEDSDEVYTPEFVSPRDEDDD